MTGLRTDLYELRMAASYLRRDMTEHATFSLFVRRLPHGRGFLVAAGLAEALAFLESFAFDDAELGYLRDLVGFDEPALTALAGLRFTGDVWAVPEGRVVFADEPLLEVTAPIAEAQLVETGVLNLITFHTTVATKAARCRLAAGGAQLVDFAFRRTHGIEAGAGVARASAIAGFAATSDVEAAMRYGLTPSGTMAHSYVEAFPDERAAFRAFAADFPTNPIFLVDTYDTPAGVRAAVDVVTELGLTGPFGVRLDSGDLGALARETRAILDGAGLRQATIFASGSLDETVIAGLVAQDAPIDGYGVGTKMGVSYDAPSLDSAYKLVAYGERPVLKLSPGKATLPAAKQVFRAPTGAAGDVVGLRDEPPPGGREPLLVQVMRGGRRLDPADPAEAVRAARGRFDADLAWLPEPATRLADPAPPAVTVSPALATLHERVAARFGRR
ncbi:nicotinate phosphoribosyltransferase [Micromonospora chaiyaphumensis]|uniref:Nicotinate phosphoribosyltransferase n=1 Tax=Micromonospora chaiyaphumensis TaxID=307119 RepID=A0A1C4U3M1_9ACTN|nr:nicotinate phosphoribosyltransferase [Micromonospora chaiyaphumensis]SCE66207.1 nicotinate phosphoribosyltransferase [Micromonospora chaiyaphumensis]